MLILYDGQKTWKSVNIPRCRNKISIVNDIFGKSHLFMLDLDCLDCKLGKKHLQLSFKDKKNIKNSLLKTLQFDFYAWSISKKSCGVHVYFFFKHPIKYISFLDNFKTFDQSSSTLKVDFECQLFLLKHKSRIYSRSFDKLWKNFWNHVNARKRKNKM